MKHFNGSFKERGVCLTLRPVCRTEFTPCRLNKWAPGMLHLRDPFCFLTAARPDSAFHAVFRAGIVFLFVKIQAHVGCGGRALGKTMRSPEYEAFFRYLPACFVPGSVEPLLPGFEPGTAQGGYV